ncbi:MAG: cupredoxin domain-containing protein [Actinomycetota bacterium]
MHKVARVLTLASLTVLALGAGLGNGFASTATVAIDTTLHPATLTVQPGTSVTWVNNDDERHRVRSKEGPVEWDSNDLEPGDSYTFTFTVEGSYPYIDERDDENTAYHGTVVVAAPSGGGGGTGGGTGGGGGGTGGGTAPAPSSAAVRIFDKSFIPDTVTIATGGTVTWSNDDDDSHTVNASAGGFASGTMNQGEKFSLRFSSAGTFSYFCAFHSDMKGTVRVQTASGTVPPPKAAAGGAGGSTSAAAAPVAAAPGQSGVSIVDFAFTPPTVRIRAGDTVAWANRGLAPHTVSAKDGSFDSGILEPGATFRRVFAKEGSFTYACALHPNMTGTVLVGAEGPAPDMSPPAAAAQPTPSGSVTANGSRGAASAQQVGGLGTGTFLGVVLGIPAILLVGSTIYLWRTSP